MNAAALQPAGAVNFRRQRRVALLASAILGATVVVPHVVVGGVALGADDLIALLLLPLAPLAMLAARDTSLAPATVLTGALWLAVLVHGCLMGLAATAEYFGHAAFPTEMWQYVKRATFFYAAFFIVSSPVAIELGIERGTLDLVQYAAVPLIAACGVAFLLSLAMKETYPAPAAKT